MKSLVFAVFAIFITLTMVCCGDDTVGTVGADDLSDVTVTVDVVEDVVESAVEDTAAGDILIEETVVEDVVVDDMDIQGE